MPEGPASARAHRHPRCWRGPFRTDVCPKAPTGASAQGPPRGEVAITRGKGRSRVPQRALTGVGDEQRAGLHLGHDVCMPVEVEFEVVVGHPEWVTFRDVHALLSSWLDRPSVTGATSGGRSDRAATHANRKPYTLRGVAAGGTTVQVRLALLDDRAPEADAVTVGDDLLTGIAEASEWSVPGGVTLGGQRYRTLPVSGSGAGVPHFRVAQYDAWEDLTTASTPARQWELRFRQPTGFRSGGVYLPFPLPDRILAGLCEVWNAQAPEELRTACPGGLECRHAQSVMLVDHATRPVRNAVPVPTGGRPRPSKAGLAARPKDDFFGFIGDAVIGLRTDRGKVPEPTAREVSTLVAFSRYAGVGAGTARGYGVTDPKARGQVASSWGAPGRS